MEYSKETKVLPVLLLILSLPLTISSCSLFQQKAQYQVNITAEPSEGGTVSPASGEHEEGSTLEITANPNEGWEFSGWRGDYTGNKSPTSISVDQDMDIDGVFRRKEYALSIDMIGAGTVDERIVKGKANDYPFQTLVELTATPREGWEFVRWKEDLESFSNPDTVLIDSEKNVSAYIGSANEAPNDRLDSEFYATLYGDGKVAKAKLTFSNGLNTTITLQRITVRSHDQKTLADDEANEILNSGEGVSYDLLLEDSPTYHQFSEHKVYWEYQLNDGYRIKIGYATNPEN